MFSLFRRRIGSISPFSKPFSTFSPLFLAEKANVVAPSVVSIYRRVDAESVSIGTGFLCGSNIITCAHVALARAHEVNKDWSVFDSIHDPVEVLFDNGTVKPGIVIAKHSVYDVAAVSLLDKTFWSDTGLPADGVELPPSLTLGSSKDALQGQFVFSIGTAFDLPNSLSAGFISSVKRFDKHFGLERMGRTYLQSDLTVTRGVSGSPMFDIDGKVIGIHFKKPSGEGPASAVSIPIDAVKQFINDANCESESFVC